MIKQIYCIGGANIDRKLKSSCDLVAKTSNPVDSVFTFGGVARNVSENLARWTKGIHLQCIVGHDELGQQLLSYVHSLGVNTKHSLIRKDKPTSHYYAILDTKGELHLALSDMAVYQNVPTHLFCEHWDAWESDSLILLDTNLPADIIELAIQHADEKGLRVCIDPVSVAKASKLPDNLENVYLIKPDIHEACEMTGTTIHSISDCIYAGRILQKRGVENVVISLGRSGYVLINEDAEEHVQTMEFNEVVDVSGAGDAFIAGILYGLQQDASLREACQIGAAAAAYTIQSPNTVAEDITVSRLQAYIHNHSIIRERADAVLF